MTVITMQQIRESIMDVQSTLVMVNAKVVTGASSNFTFLEARYDIAALLNVIGPGRSSAYIETAITEFDNAHIECYSNDGVLTPEFEIYMSLCVANLRAAYINLGA